MSSKSLIQFQLYSPKNILYHKARSRIFYQNFSMVAVQPMIAIGNYKTLWINFGWLIYVCIRSKPYLRSNLYPIFRRLSTRAIQSPRACEIHQLYTPVYALVREYKKILEFSKKQD